MFSVVLLLAEEAAKGADAPFWANPLMPLFVMAPLMIWMMWRAKRQEQRQRENLFASLKKNDKVLTTGGMIGLIAAVKENEDEVTLKVDESSNVRIRVVKSAIVRVLSSEPAEKDGKKETAP